VLGNTTATTDTSFEKVEASMNKTVMLIGRFNKFKSDRWSIRIFENVEFL
jgi:hypothetical protein